jgi:hypothetical protein
MSVGRRAPRSTEPTGVIGVPTFPIADSTVTAGANDVGIPRPSIRDGKQKPWEVLLFAVSTIDAVTSRRRAQQGGHDHHGHHILLRRLPVTGYEMGVIIGGGARLLIEPDPEARQEQDAKDCLAEDSEGRVLGGVHSPSCACPILITRPSNASGDRRFEGRPGHAKRWSVCSLCRRRRI